MRQNNEVKKLQNILANERLSSSERAALERRLRQLKSTQWHPDDLILEGVFGMFDRPKPSEEDSKSGGEEDAAPTGSPELSKKPDPAHPELPAVPELTPEEAEVIATQIAEIAERIVLLRSVWARTLSREIEAEGEAWLERLQALAAKIPEELAETALGPNVGLLRQKPLKIAKGQISEELQLTQHAPSCPSLDPTEVWTDIYYGIHQPRRPSPPEHPPGYIPDGLQQFV